MERVNRADGSAWKWACVWLLGIPSEWPEANMSLPYIDLSELAFWMVLQKHSSGSNVERPQVDGLARACLVLLGYMPWIHVEPVGSTLLYMVVIRGHGWVKDSPSP